MKRRIGMQALSMLLAVLLMGMVMVPAVSAESDGYTTAEDINGDIKGIFDNASALETLPETLPLSLSPQAEQEYMENYVSPASMAITAMKAKGYSESQITDVLRENGYGWYPATGACWKGRAPTPEEQKVIDQIRGPGYTPFPESQKNDSRSLNSLTSSLRGAGATLNLWNEEWRLLEIYNLGIS